MSKALVNQGRPFNSLARQKNPFLYAGRYSPINWQPWSAHVLARARREAKPLLLSVDRRLPVPKTAWAEDPAVVRLLNRHFIPVQVDQEEFPEVDYYCTLAMQLLLGRYQRPYLICLTPQGHPWTGWYGMDKVLKEGNNEPKMLIERLIHLWQHKRVGIERQAQQLSQALDKLENAYAGVNAMPFNRDLVEQHMFDLKRKAEGQRMRAGQWMELLFYESERTGDEKCLDLIRTTLEAMALDEEHDQNEGGFFSEPEPGENASGWKQKALALNVLMTRRYIHAYRLLGRQAYADWAAQTMAWVLRDLRLKNGFLARACWMKHAKAKRCHLDRRWPLGANALTVSTLIDLGRYLNRLDFLEQAEKLLVALEDRFRHGWGYFRMGSERGYFGRATLQDWTLLAGAMLDAGKLNPSGPWLKRACRLIDRIDRHFAVPRPSWGTGNYAPLLADPLFQSRHPYDDLLASGQAMLAQHLITLARLSRDAAYQEKAFNLLNSFYHVAVKTRHGLEGLMLAQARFFDQRMLPVLTNKSAGFRQIVKKMGSATACLRLFRPTAYAGEHLPFELTLTLGAGQEVVMTAGEGMANGFDLNLEPRDQVRIKRLSLCAPQHRMWQGERVRAHIYHRYFKLKGFINIRDDVAGGRLILHWRFCLPLRQAGRETTAATVHFAMPVVVKTA